MLAGGLLVALCHPRAAACSSRTRASTATRAASRSSRRYDRIQAAFPGGAVPATIVDQGQGRHRRARSRPAIKQLHDQALATGSCPSPRSVDISPDKTVAVVALSVKGNGTDAASERSLEVLRSEVVPATVGRLAGAEVAVTGMTAELEGLHRHA